MILLTAGLHATHGDVQAPNLHDLRMASDARAIHRYGRSP